MLSGLREARSAASAVNRFSSLLITAMRRLTLIGTSAKKQAALHAPQRSSARSYWGTADISQPDNPH
jgi:hypothetical protein